MKLSEVKPGETYAWASSQWEADRGHAKPFTAKGIEPSNAGSQRRVSGAFGARETTVSARKLWGLWLPYSEKWAVIRRQLEDQEHAIDRLRSTLEAAGLRSVQELGSVTQPWQRVTARYEYGSGGPAGIEVVLDTEAALKLALILGDQRKGYSFDVGQALARADAALSVLTISPRILAWLEANDRSALAQARSALEALDAARAAPAEEVPV